MKERLPGSGGALFIKKLQACPLISQISSDGRKKKDLGEGGDYHLGASSPCIDAGIDAGVYTDIDGDTRPNGAGYDIGSDEY